jgi:hypothetical protein
VLTLVAASAAWATAEGGAAPKPPVTAAPAAVKSPPPKDREFLAFDPHYLESRARRSERARALGKQVITRERAGRDVRLSHQILSEVIWLLSATADFGRIDRRLDELQASLDHPEREGDGHAQDPDDGSWGRGYTEWFFRLAASYPNFDRPGRVPFRLLDRVNSPEKLTDYLLSVSASDIARTGRDNERELNESLSCLLRMVVRGEPKGYPYDPRLKGAMLDLVLHRLRNPASGFWGERYARGGGVVFEDNLSITFHVVSYLGGDVPDMDKVVATTLAVRDEEFPAGWRLNGRYWDHLNMDVAEIFRLGWPHASAGQREAIAGEVDKMLRWCLAESLLPDGSFRFVEGDNSREEGTYYGASFLARVGYFDKSKRFWTSRDFPEAEGVRQKIIANVLKHRGSGAAGGDYYEGALSQLGYDAAGRPQQGNAP